MRRARSDSVEAMVEAVKAVAAGDIDPPGHLRLGESVRPFWVAITRARARKEWNQVDLQHAANLARCQADIERISDEVLSEGDLLLNMRGTMVMNPKHALLEILSRRAVALTKLLQIQPAAAGDAKNKAGARSAENLARETAGEIQNEEARKRSLLA